MPQVLSRNLLPALPSLQLIPILLETGILGNQLPKPKLLRKHTVRQMRQIRKCDLVTRKVLLLGKHPLVALEGGVELRKQRLDARFVGLALALHGLPDLLVGELGDQGIEVGHFDGHGLLSCQCLSFSFSLVELSIAEVHTCWYRAYAFRSDSGGASSVPWPRYLAMMY